MASYVKTADLKKLIPKTLNSKELEYLTGVPHKRMWSIKAERTEFTDYYLADKICVGLDRIADFHLLEEYEDKPKVRPDGRKPRSTQQERKHGIASYNNRGCRCNVCKEAKRLADYRRNKSEKRKESNARYRAKLRGNANSN